MQTGILPVIEPLEARIASALTALKGHSTGGPASFDTRIQFTPRDNMNVSLELRVHNVRIERLEARISPAFASVIDLSALDGLTGFKMSGVTQGDSAGISVSDAGDVNGDGFGDLIVGANQADGNGVFSGASYIVFGKAGPFDPAFNLSSLNGSNGFKINGEAPSDQSGRSVSGAGDVNRDGFDDLLIGARGARPNGIGSGASYVVFGKANGFSAILNLSTLDGTNGFQINGEAAPDQFGRAVSGAGDVNGDGFDDLLIGAYKNGANGVYNSGASYVIFGKSGGFSATVSVSSLNGTNGFKLNGEAQLGYSGSAVGSAGDVNGDGLDDLFIGARGVGAGYVVFGTAEAFPAALNLSTLNGSNGFKLTPEANFEQFGYSVSGTGDVNGDGLDDLLIGAPLHSSVGNFARGAAYVIFGSDGVFASAFSVAALNGVNGFKIGGIAADTQAGISVSGAGDVNGDGFDDVFVGSSLRSGAGGSGYLVFGQSSFTGIFDLSSLNGMNGFKINGLMPADFSHEFVSGAGDINRDGFADLLLGSARSAPSGGFSGASYVVFGAPTATVTINDGAAVEGDAGTTDVVFTASLSAKSTVPVSVRYSTQSGTAEGASDFISASSELITFAPGETSKTITIPIIGETTFESEETFSVVLSNAKNAVLLDESGTGTIQNDDAPPIVDIAASSVVEGDSGIRTLTFAVALAEASGFPATVQFTIRDGTAIAGSDYSAAPSGTLNIGAGATMATFSVDVLGDTSIEEHENFSVVLSDPSGATIGSGTALGTIFNDDTTVQISEAATSLEGNNGPTPMLFTVSLAQASALPVTVDYGITEGTATAGNENDFTAPPPGSQIVFAPGELTKTISVDVHGDTTIEPHETFSVILSAATNAAITGGVAIATILNDETLVRVNDASILEGHAGKQLLSFNVSLSAETALPVSVNFATADLSASAGNDYIALPLGTLTFVPGETSKSLSVDVAGDISLEPSETFSLLLADATNAVIEDAGGVGTILNDDVTLRGKRIATFTDVDGEKVTIKVSKGTLKVEHFTIFPSGSGSQLALIDFTNETQFAGANLRIRSKPATAHSAGDGFVDVGHINLSGIDFGTITVQGDAGQIDVGDAVTPQRALLGLRANSIGARGLATQLPGGSLQSDIVGPLKMLGLASDMQDAVLSVSGDIGTATIAGSVVGSAIQSDGKIAAIRIGGDLVGNEERGATISARGIASPTSNIKALAIANISVRGSIERTQILAGYDMTGAAINADAAIGAISVGADWKASNLIAGAAAGADALFGTEDDALISGANPVVAKIGSILIKGVVTGTQSGNDHFGFVAEEIGAFKANDARFKLVGGPGNDVAGLPLGLTGDVSVREVPAIR